MAVQKRRRPKIKFELSRSGIGGIAIVCFCILLWMFLLGVWAGQSLLRPSKPVSAGFDAGSVKNEQPVEHLEAEKKIKP
jgi:hypothetical protein